VAAVLSLCLCLVSLVFARFQPGTLMIRSWFLAILLLSVGFFISGIGRMLPNWATMIGSNSLLLMAGSILYSGFSSYFHERKMPPDWPGWIIVLLSIPAFWYWGLIEPNGHARSMVFSVAMAAINSRTALLLGRAATQRKGNLPTRAMAALFVTLTTWMVIRFFILLLSHPAPPNLRGANPTQWQTVFGYIVLISLMSVCIMWMEVSRLRTNQADASFLPRSVSEFMLFFRTRLILLWSTVTVLIASVVSMLGIGYVNIRDLEKTRLVNSTKLINDAFVEHTLQITSQADTILRSVRGFYMRTRSLQETKSFIHTLGFDTSIIDNVYLIASDGQIIITHDTAALGRNVKDRDYFSFHRATAADQINISPVEHGRVTGKYHFRVTRRINNPDGSFGGLVLVTVNPDAFSRYYRNLASGSQNVASLLGMTDHRLRARLPVPTVERWSEPVESPIWEMLKQSPTGQYENTSQVDNIRRQFVYQQVGQLPLVMVTGFSDGDLQQGIRMRMSWLLGATLTILLFMVMLALLLTVETRRREEQQRATALLEQNAQRLQEAQTIGRIGDWEYDPVTETVTFSNELFALFEREPTDQQILFSEALLVFLPEDRPTVQGYFTRALATGIGWEHEVRIMLPSGKQAWHCSIGSAITDSRGTVVRIHGVTQDITRRKEAETALLEQKEQLRNLFDHAPVGIFHSNLHGQLLTANDALARMLGYGRPEELVAAISNMSEQIYAEPDKRPQIMMDLLNTDQWCHYDAVLWKHRDGRHIIVDMTGRRVCDQSGNLLYLEGFIADITHIKQMEAELVNRAETLQLRVNEETSRRIANERLLIQRSKLADMGEMIGAIAHQWRQPLATVGVIFQNLLTARRLNKLDETYLEKASTDATALINHMSRTIDSFRNFFKPEKTRERFNPVEKIEDAANFIRAQLKGYGITIQLPDHGATDHMITGFPNEFTQVMLNLFANARDAILEKQQHQGSGDNHISVTIQTDDQHLVIMVRDTGCGIPQEVASRIFDPYFTTKTESQGTGIGLYMSKQIIEESMGGSLTFTSKPGTTIFRIELPHD
jgi:PAS domain S-box-containing protein